MTTEAAPFAITDPQEAPTYGDGPLSRWCKGALYEARDEVFVRLTLKMNLLFASMMVALFYVLRTGVVHPLVAAAVYFTLWGWFTPPVILMLHNTMHRPFIKSPKWLDRVHPFVMSFFHGIPTGYADHHLGMHHYEDNMPDDLSSTMRYRRDSFLAFLVYWARFFFLVAIELPLYLRGHRRFKMARRALFGEIGHLSVVAASLWLDWRFGLVAFAIPTISVRTMMMVGNWGQHAFLNTGRKNDGLSNSCTCINSTYNRRAFNDGYHIGHHLKANRHWTELPKDLVDNAALYRREDAVVFEGIDFFMVSVLLWTGSWKTLAKRFVRLDGQPRTDEEVIAMLKSRVQPLRDWPTEAAPVAAE